jgi:hypothetical protein
MGPGGRPNTAPEDSAPALRPGQDRLRQEQNGEGTTRTHIVPAGRWPGGETVAERTFGPECDAGA